MTPRTCRGYTLIELCVSMSVGSSLMVLAVGLLHQTLSLSSVAKSHADQHRAMERLAQDFRHDVHLAVAANVDEPTAIDLEREDGSIIRYRADSLRIRREQQSDGKIQRREEYQFARPVAVQFEILAQPDRVAVNIRSATDAIGPQTAPARTLGAALGRRLAHQRAEVNP